MMKFDAGRQNHGDAMDIMGHFKCQRWLVARDLGARKDRLHRWLAELHHHSEKIEQALHADLQKPSIEAYLSEVYFSKLEVRHALRHLSRWARYRRVRTNFIGWPAQSGYCHVPVGLVLVVGPWNYPFVLTCGPMVSALAAGNQVLLKPSEHAPATADLLTEMVRRAFSADEVQVVKGGPEVTQNLIAQRPDYVFYTGGQEGGQAVMKACAQELIPLTLELGGKNPCVLFNDVPIDRALKRILAGKFFNAGQTCVAPDFLWVSAEIFKEVKAHAVDLLQQYFPTAMQMQCDVSRQPSVAHYQRLIRLLSGSDQIFHVHPGQDCQLPPTLVFPQTMDEPIMQQEIFGPILPIVTFVKVKEVFDYLQRQPSPLALYVFTQDRRQQQSFRHKTQSGALVFNDTMVQLTNLRLPFGGVGGSGFGSCHGEFGFQTFSHKRVEMRRSWLSVASLYPPYQESAVRWLKRFMR